MDTNKLQPVLTTPTLSADPLPQITFNGVTYNVVCRLTLSDMLSQGLQNAASDFQARGIGALLTLVRPKGRNATYDGYERLDGTVFAVDRANW